MALTSLECLRVQRAKSKGGKKDMLKVLDPTKYAIVPIKPESKVRKPRKLKGGLSIRRKSPPLMSMM